MPAEAITFTPTADDMPRSGGLYSEIEVPGDYEVVLRDVDSYDKGEGRRGWIFLYDCETPSGGTVEFKWFLSFNQKARWKITETFATHGQVIEEGQPQAFDPNALIGTMVGAHIDFDRDDNGEPSNPYRAIQRIFPLVDAPAEEEASTPQPVDLDAEAPATI